ncbi:uncharacterized protein LOC115965895 [Quercus lobata]|uniref:uncharacterized protein LOC115965895 n=1 Tax=Quercus lobata TaxID=97700 RepID=UPI001245FCAC|nr:uncharacterized protein LOC115965895 [Quercus lobata]
MQTTLSRSPHANRSSTSPPSVQNVGHHQSFSPTTQRLHLLRHHPSPAPYLSASVFFFQTRFSPQTLSRDANKMLSEVQNRNSWKTSMDSEHMWNRPQLLFQCPSATLALLFVYNFYLLVV